jgi:hypothetical protein
MAVKRQNVFRRASIAAACAAVSVLSLAGASGRAQTGCVPQDFTAWAVNRGASAIFLASAVDIHIVRWSTETEKDRFAGTLLDRGPHALLKALRDADHVGQIRTPLTLSYPLQFAWQEPVGDGGRRIILITDRPMDVWKEAMRLREIDDTFTVMEIRLTLDSEGEGKVAIGSNISVNRHLDLIELKEYDTALVRLTDVRTKRPTP